ncbi:MAG: zinc-finger-containing protein [Psychrobacillus sp.]
MQCPYCKGEAELLTTKEFYGKDYGNHVYVCRPCQASVQTHMGTLTPQGELATRDLKDLRHMCHVELDPYWQMGYMTRAQFYTRIKQVLKLKGNRGSHIGYLTKEECERLLRAHKEGRFCLVPFKIQRKSARSFQRQ